MAQVTLKGNPVQVNGNLPQAGAQAPAFSLVGEGLADKSLKDYLKQAQGAEYLPKRRYPDLRHLGAQVQRPGQRRCQHRGAVHLG